MIPKTAFQLLIGVFCLFLSINVNAQQFEWAGSIGDSLTEIVNASAVDASGNIYTIGTFMGTVDFDPGVGTTNLTSSGDDDIFIQKLDASGNFLWAKSFGGNASFGVGRYDLGTSISTDDSGNVYTTGYFIGTVDFDPGAGISNLSSVGGNDIFIQKLDSSGNFQWARSFGGSGSDEGYSIKVDDLGNVYTTGRFNDTVDFDPGAGIANLVSAGNRPDIFVLKLDPFGNFQWAKSFFGSDFDLGYSIALDTSGNVYTTGYFDNTVDFDPGFFIFNLTTTGRDDVFINKLDASGDFVWARSFGGASIDQGYSITVDESANVYTVGTFLGTVDFDPGPGIANLTSAGFEDVFIQKLDASGNFLWAKSFGSVSDDYGFSVTLDTSGNVYTTGSFRGAVDFDPGIGTAILSSGGSNSSGTFIQKLDASGSFLWAKAFRFSQGSSINLDHSGNLYTSGSFAGTVDFDPGPGTANLSSTGPMGSDVFVQKMSQNIITLISESDLSSNPKILAFPNPSNGQFQLSIEDEGKVGLISITDIQGRLIDTMRLEELVDNQFHIEGPAGIYFLKIETQHSQSVVKLVKE